MARNALNVDVRKLTFLTAYSPVEKSCLNLSSEHH